MVSIILPSNISFHCSINPNSYIRRYIKQCICQPAACSLSLSEQNPATINKIIKQNHIVIQFCLSVNYQMHDQIVL